MHELLDGADGELLELDAYYQEFEDHFWRIGDPGFWKLERQQFFREPSFKSWLAFDQGDWAGALRLLEDGRQELIDHHRQVVAHGFTTQRIRVVEDPVIPYLQWELQALRIRDQCGGNIRVIPATKIEEFERTSPLPELNVLGTRVMYQVLYDERGVIEAARRFDDRDVITRCQRFIETLYNRGEPLEDYFVRDVAALPPPKP